MDKLKMQTGNIVDENIEFLQKKFANCIVEGRDENGNITKMVDFDLLKQELSKVVVDGDKERYTMTWPDKKQAILTANSPIAKTLRPCRDKSVNFEYTKNIYIEGDNLDVLKVLRETYLGKVTMIYIDPPYNTGNDFVYNDDFATDTDEYLERSNQVDEEWNRMVVNSDSNGRFHTDWLNMIYPRLKVSKDLLTDDGVIFISIDDNEVMNMKKLCNEIFGEQNFISQLIWRKKTGASDSVGFSVICEYILVYVKNLSFVQKIFTQDLNAHDVNRYRLSDEYESRRGKYYIDNLDRGGIHYSDSLNYPITCPDGTVTYPNGRKEFTREGWTWTWGKEKLEWGLKNGFIEFRKSTSKDSGWAVCYKNYLNVNNKDELVARSAPHKNMIMDILNTSATLEIQKLFGGKVFQYTKPSALLKLLLSYVNTKDGIILDFFSGSATTAHAVMQLNAEDGGNRKYIMVQLPEVCDEKSEAYKAGYKTICEIGEERIRRAGQNIASEIKNAKIVYGVKPNNKLEPTEENKAAIQMAIDKIKEDDFKFIDNREKNIPDIGFRVFKLDSSNMKDTYYKPSEYTMSLLDTLDENIKPDRTPEDLLFQVMLDLGLMLDSKIEEKDINGKKVFIVGEYNEMIKPDLMCCFDANVDNDTVTEIAKMQPRFAVFRDSSMAKDSVAINFDQIFETYSPSTTRKVL
ncbi:MAG: site-specific DNA-methyltransferase [Candidatus Caccovivens sp.]